MKEMIFNRARSGIVTALSGGVGLVAILALFVVLQAGNAEAVSSEQSSAIQHSSDTMSGNNDVILLAAADVKKEAKSQPPMAKKAKAAPAKDAKAKAEKKSYGPVGSVFNFLGSNMFVFLFLSLALGYPLGRVTVKGINLVCFF